MSTAQEPTIAAAAAEKPSSAFYQRLRSQVLELLERGRPGDRVPPEKELARLFGVSHMTMGRLVQELQQEGVVQRIRGKGTFICDSAGEAPQPGILGDQLAEITGRVAPLENGMLPSFARTLPQKVTILLEDNCQDNDLLVVRRRQWHYRALSQIENLVQRAGGTTVMVDLREFAGPALLERLVQVEPDIMVMVPINRMTENWTAIRQYQRGSGRTIPISCTNLGNFTPRDVDCVGYDSASGICLAVDHLLELGHKSLAYMFPEVAQPYAFVTERIEMLQDKAQAEGFELQLLPVSVAHLNFEANRLWEISGTEAATALLPRLLKADAPTAILAANDMMAGSFLSHLRSKNESLANQLSLVGYDNDLLWSARHNLTTVHPPIEELAECALALAQQRMVRPFAGSISVTLQPRLVVRCSTAPPRREEI